MIEKYPPYKVYDNLIPPKVQDMVENTIFCNYTNYHIPLFYRGNLTGNKNSSNKPEEKGFGTQIVGLDDSIIERKINVHPSMGFFLTPLYLITSQLGKTLWQIYNARIFMMMAIEKNIPTYPHVDIYTPHWVCLYYVNDTDGDTIFYNQDKTIMDKVTPKKGRCVIFDGSIYHSASTPTLKDRAIINYNFSFMEPKLDKI